MDLWGMHADMRQQKQRFEAGKRRFLFDSRPGGFIMNQTHMVYMQLICVTSFLLVG
jgi:hypothetical protein